MPVSTTSARAAHLWDALCQAHQVLGSDAVADEVFRLLVCARIFEPTSKVDSLRALLTRLCGVLFTRARPGRRGMHACSCGPDRQWEGATSADNHGEAPPGGPVEPTAWDLADAVIWGILFRLPCARFTPGRADDQRPPWARPVPTLERD